MYNCQNCGAVSKPNEPVRTRVLETRPRVYTKVFREEDEETGRTRYIERVIGRGTEIVKQVNLCPPCAGEPVVDSALTPGTREALSLEQAA